MKFLKLLFLIIVVNFLFTSCTTINEVEVSPTRINERISLNNLITSYDLWYIDYQSKKGAGEIPFLSRAFTLSFINGIMYANNNIVDVGKTGNGVGVAVGNYNTFNTLLETGHGLDGRYNFEVEQLSKNEIRIYDTSSNISYLLIGYQRNNFDYDKLFYDNIEYFLQEYVAWEREKVLGGHKNVFDQEQYLKFTAKNDATFYSSKNRFGINIDNIRWSFTGNYTVYDVKGYSKLKGLELVYRNGDTEMFELKVINDGVIQLYHQNSKTTYMFLGKGFIQYLRPTKNSNKTIQSSKMRTKVTRKTVDRTYLK